MKKVSNSIVIKFLLMEDSILAAERYEENGEHYGCCNVIHKCSCRECFDRKNNNRKNVKIYPCPFEFPGIIKGDCIEIRKPIYKYYGMPIHGLCKTKIPDLLRAIKKELKKVK